MSSAIPHSERATIRQKRAEEMASKYQSGATLQEIGDFYGITRERVRQLISGHTNTTSKDGGVAVRSSARKAALQKRREQKYWSTHGMSETEFNSINDKSTPYWHRPIGCFKRQKQNSRTRGIEWKLTFAEWWAIWSASGKWDERGRGSGYCMARHGDTGPYEIGNVKIIPGPENQAEYIRRYWKQVRNGEKPLPKNYRAKKTHCKRGHEFTEENTYVPPGTTQRTCKECRRIRERKRLKKRSVQ